MKNLYTVEIYLNTYTDEKKPRLISGGTVWVQTFSNKKLAKHIAQIAKHGMGKGEK
jgi:hypothetical protein